MNSPLAARPRKSIGVGSSTGNVPVTPRARPRPSLVHSITPESSPSLSASVPFDWDAFRGKKPAPYSTPLRVKQLRRSEAGAPGTPKRTVRQKSWKERIEAVPSDIMFQISLFPDNIVLLEPKTSATFIGSVMHFAHFCVRISSSRKAIEDAAPWDDYSGGSNNLFDWTLLVTTTLLLSSFYVAFKLFTSFKTYDLLSQPDPVSSPRAAFVSTNLNREMENGPSILRRTLSWMSYQWSVSWRFLFNMKPPAQRLADVAGVDKVQQLRVWTPGDLEVHLFIIYSPAHSFLWMATNFSNWILMFIIMGIVGIQAQLLLSSYEGRIKDKGIIAGEVMNEYNLKFVKPRVFPIRCDKSVTTNEAEMVH